jgi:hypothetical protein
VASVAAASGGKSSVQRRRIPAFNNSPCNSGRAPKRVRDGHLPDQASDVGADLRAAARTRPTCPVPREAAAMPGDDGGRSADH